MSDPPGEWVSTPEIDPKINSEWTSEPLGPSSPPRADSGWKTVWAIGGGLLSILGLVILGVYLVEDYTGSKSDTPARTPAKTIAASPGKVAPAAPSHRSNVPAPSIPPKARESTQAGEYWVSANSPGLPRVDLKLSSGPLPPSIKLGDVVTIDLEAACLATGQENSDARDGRTRGGISVSVKGNAALRSASDGAERYSVGSEIAVFERGSSWISHQHARNELIEKTANPWHKGSTLSLRVVATPKALGDLTFYVRSTATLRKRPVSSTESSSELDQQGLPAQTFHMTVTE